MVIVTEVAERIYLISEDDLFSDLRERSASYLVWGEKSALIETGPASVAPRIREGFRQLAFDPTELAYIIPTHIHIDHGGGAGLWARELPQAKVVLHPDGIRHMLDTTRLIASTRLAFGDDFEDRLGPILPVPPAQVHEARDGELISLGDRELKVIFTPGHAPHHISILDMKGRGLFSGEALGIPAGKWSIPMPAATPPSFDLEQVLQTIAVLAGLRPAAIFYSHGGVSRDVPGSIAIIERHTRSLGTILEKAFREGEDFGQMQEKLGTYMQENTGGADDFSLSITVEGYLSYFQRKARGGLPKRSQPDLGEGRVKL